LLLGHDPVAYFTHSQSIRGDPAIKTTLPGRTYYFMTENHKRMFLADPAKYEPQYGGFCSSGAAFAIKLDSDPTEWQIVNGRLYIFGDVMGHEAWRLDPQWNIEHGDQVWPEAHDVGWRWQSLKRYVRKVPWYKNTGDIRREFAAKYPGRKWRSTTGAAWRQIYSSSIPAGVLARASRRWASSARTRVRPHVHARPHNLSAANPERAFPSRP